jgi:hypothetical protein
MDSKELIANTAAKIAEDSPYAQFATDKKAEQEGVVINYGPFWFRIARTGGANTRYTKRLNAEFKPHRRSIQTDTVKDELLEDLVRKVFIETAILGAGSTKYGSGVLVGKDGSAIQVNAKSLEEMFTELPDLLKDLQEQAGKVSLFRVIEAEEDAKN